MQQNIDHVKKATMAACICMGYLYLAIVIKSQNGAFTMASVGFGLLVLIGGAIALLASIIYPVLFIFTLPIWLFTIFNVRSMAKAFVRKGLI